MTATVAAFGLSVEVPAGWEAEIYRREPDAVRGEVTMPILHAANVPLARNRGDYGGGTVETLGQRGVFVALLEHDVEAAHTALFSERRVPWPLSGGEFRPNALQRNLPGQAGCQSFFVTAKRALCLYVVIGSFGLRHVLASEANRLLSAVRVSATFPVAPRRGGGSR